MGQRGGGFVQRGRRIAQRDRACAVFVCRARDRGSVRILGERQCNGLSQRGAQIGKGYPQWLPSTPD